MKLNGILCKAPVVPIGTVGASEITYFNAKNKKDIFIEAEKRNLTITGKIIFVKVFKFEF